MKKRGFLLIIFVLSAMLTLFFGSVSAQDINVDEMSNAELMLLLQAIMEQLGETGTTAGEEAEPTPLPTEDPLSPLKTVKFKIYENKKLMIEALPGYMFIPKQQESDPQQTPNPPGKTTDGHDGDDDHGDPPICLDGTYGQWVCDINGRCYWTCAKG